MESIKWHIQDEWSPLKAVMVGIGEGMGLAPTLAETYDPQSRLHVAQGTYPTEDAVAHELNCLAALLTRNGIQVLRPDSIGINQVFTRDIGLVIDGKFIMTHLVEDRVNEQKGLESMLNRYPGTLIHPPASVRMEGGDIMPMGDEIWVGYAGEERFSKFTTARTNVAAIEWLRSQFPQKQILGFELEKSDSEPLKNALHLDCCCAPLGLGHLMIHRPGFARDEELNALLRRYSDAHIMDVSAEEMQDMHCNVLSLEPGTVVSNRSAKRTNEQMRAWGYDVIEAELNETSKMGGLLRCSTLPLRRN